MAFALYIGYSFGAYNYGGWIFGADSQVPYTESLRKIGLKTPDWTRLWHLVGVGGVMGALTFMHYRFPWWPLHPIGMPVGICSYPMTIIVFSIFVSWLAKWAIMRSAAMGFWMVGTTMWKMRGAQREDRETLPANRGDIPIHVALGIWALSTLGFVVVVWWLVPGFPWWISALFGFVWTPIYSFIGARMIGLTGSPQGVSFPYLRKGSFYLSGYQGAAVWFAPIPMFN